MRKKLLIRLVLAALSLVVLCAYSCGGPSLPPSTSGGGFFIETEFLSLTGPITPQPIPFVTTGWTWLNDVSGFTAVGDPSPFDNTTNAAAIGVSGNGRVPAMWAVSWKSGGPPVCIGAPDDPIFGHFQSNPQRTTEVVCFEHPATQLQASQDFGFNPDPIYTDGSSGNTATIYGQGFSAQYGMPLLQYYDSNGNLVQQTTATTVASDGSWITAPVPDISQVQVGAYVGFLYSMDSTGRYIYLGTSSVFVSDPPPPPDPGCGSGPPYTYCP